MATPNNLTLIDGSATFVAGKFSMAVQGGAYRFGSPIAFGTSYTIVIWAQLPVSGTGTAVLFGAPNFWIGASNGNPRFGNIIPPLTSVTVNDGNWHQYVLVVTSGGCKLYVDGALIGSSSTVPTFDATTAIGKYGNDAYNWPGPIDVVAIFDGALYTAPFTPSQSAYGGLETGLKNLYQFNGDLTDSAGSGGPTMGLSASDSGVLIGLISLSGFATVCYYRSAVANFVPSPSTLIATHTLAANATTDSYPDTAASATGAHYKAIAYDSNSNPTPVLPSGETGATLGSYSLWGRKLDTPIVLVGIGHSILAGALADPGIGPLGPMADFLSTAGGFRRVPWANCAQSGTSTGDWLPGSTLLNNAESQITTLMAANPTARLLVLSRLDANDASHGVSAADYQTNMTAIVGDLHSKFPTACILMGYPLWFSDNTVYNNSTTFDGSTLDRIISYKAPIAAIAAANPTYAHAGDETAFAVFADGYKTLLAPESGSNGTCFLHPSHQGNIRLGELDGKAGASAMGLFGTAGPTVSAADLRYGTVVGAVTGTAHIPTASQTLDGVPVDNTVGNVVQAPANKVAVGTYYGPASSIAGTLAPGSGSTVVDLTTAALDAIAGRLLVVPANKLATSSTGFVSVNLAQKGLVPRDLSSVADADLTLGDSFVAAICGSAGKESTAGTVYLVKTPSTGTLIRQFTLDSATAPTSRS